MSARRTGETAARLAKAYLQQKQRLYLCLGQRPHDSRHERGRSRHKAIPTTAFATYPIGGID
ncbi:hypothetical protein [Pontibacter sp. HSC-36F09]|uniref:hypothetical protein n=1 Tax=Pontibacter sp. HSC-36F09 TaxID=2910966 RepID=UPI0020A1B2E0|nr:hypothetical protein [Pontibacter sp. HSC-36F09]